MDANNEDLVEAGMTLTIPPSKKVNNNNIVFANMKEAANIKHVANFFSPNIIFVYMQMTHPNAVTTACQQIRVSRMFMGGVGTTLFIKVGADLNLFLLT